MTAKRAPMIKRAASPNAVRRKARQKPAAIEFAVPPLIIVAIPWTAESVLQTRLAPRTRPAAIRVAVYLDQEIIQQELSGQFEQ